MDWRNIISQCNWDELTGKLKIVDQTIGEIFQIDDLQVIPSDKSKLLRDYATANKKILNKLESHEFTVAIVGLENSGKSTLGNALINANVLPEFRERCTYTTTEIRSGEEDVAEVYFYSRAEFIDIFKGMLQTVDYPNYAGVNFESMSAKDFDDYWNGVGQDLNKKKFFEEHNKKTAEDIKVILAGKNDIVKLLDKEPERFSAAKWTSDTFKRYITGILDENATPIQRVASPYAVKNVIIRSTQLAQMSNIVIYDVPGFNSPTEIHQNQTEEMLNLADAIIFVSNILNPNLDGLQLTVLNKNKQDDDNIELRDKVFVFGNQIDRTNNRNVALANLETLRHEAVEDHKIAVAERVMAGSARAFIESQGTIPPEKRVVNQDFYNWNLADGDGIETLREKLQHYYNTNRFEIIKKRAKNNLGKIEELLRDLVNFFELEIAKNPNMPEFTAKFALEISNKLDKFIDEAHEIIDNCRLEINATRPFTSLLKNDIAIIYPLTKDSAFPQKLIQHVEQSLSVDLDGVYPLTAVDSNIRNELSKIFIKNIVVSASKLTMEKQKNLRSQLVDSFLKNMDMEIPNPSEENLKKSVNELFDFMLTHGEMAQVDFKCNFNSLVERFTATITQTLILAPFASNERLNKICESLKEFIILAVYYNKFNSANYRNTARFENIGDNGMNFFLKILAHEGISHAPVVKANNPNDKIIAANKNFFDQLITKNSSDRREYFPIQKWAERLAKSGISLSENSPLTTTLNTIFKYYARGKYSYATCNSHVENAINQVANAEVSADTPIEPVIKNSKDFSGTLIEQIEKINNDTYASRTMRSKAQMINILDTDIEVLRDIMASAVIDAIGLERAFISVVTKNVELIREHLRRGEGQSKFNDWIIANARLLLPSKFNIQQQETYDARVKIINSIESRLNITDKEVMFSGI